MNGYKDENRKGNGECGECICTTSRMHGGRERHHGWKDDGNRNSEGMRILESVEAMDMKIGNTLYKKREEHLLTYSSGGSQPD